MVEKNGEVGRLRVELASLRSRLATREEEFARLGVELAEARRAAVERNSEVEALRRDLRVARTLLGEKDAAVQAVQSSLSWRITAPLRAARALVVRRAGAPRAGSSAGDPIDPATMIDAAPKVCVFAHHGLEADVAGYVFELLAGISSAGYKILFVSSAEGIDRASLDRLHKICTGVFTRRNAGRDFGSWQFGLRHIKNPQGLNWLLLANDSVFGPLFDLGDVAEKMERSGADFWGITDCYQHMWHLQSYFVCLKGAVVRSEAFRAFIAKDFAGLAKPQIIEAGEIALSQELLGAGFRGAAYCPYDALDEGKNDFSHNPMHHYWRKLITRAGCPFLKIELLRDNPLKVPEVERFGPIVSAVSCYDVRLMERHLAALRSASNERRAQRLA